jgi:UV DNA damage repair endonuclease
MHPFNTNTKRIGFVCKWIDRPDQIDTVKAKDDAKKYNTSTTTVAWLNRQSKSVAEQKMWDLMVQNIESIRLLINRVGDLEPGQRMVRLSSEVLPCYTEPTWKYFWQRPDVISYMEKHFRIAGDIARSKDVRLSFHPGQFTVLASHRPDVVDLSIEEVEYHTNMARWMGYGQKFGEFKINIHISGKLGPDGVRAQWGKLSPEARNCLTIENEEISHGLDDCLNLSDIIPIVLDIHHHWIREGEYIQANDARIKRILDSWRGIRPVVHYSVSREEHLVGHATDILPDHASLISAGHHKQKLRAHSDFYWNTAVTDWALTHLQWADLMLECKSKNLGSSEVYRYAVNQGLY